MKTYTFKIDLQNGYIIRSGQTLDEVIKYVDYVQEFYTIKRLFIVIESGNLRTPR